MFEYKRLAKVIITGGLAFAACACTSTNATQVLNPFYEPPSEVAYLGNPNDSALHEGGNKEEEMRANVKLGQYQRTHTPKPYNPVVNPSVIRLMWVPDHVNRTGDLVPAHYYYLKVKKDQWALKDAWDQQDQVDNTGTRGGASNVPFVYQSK